MSRDRVTQAELFNACRTIFGSDVSLSVEFLECLRLEGLKTAYRKRAKETHPDRARALGVYRRELNAQFLQVRQAYEMLQSYLGKDSGTVFFSQHGPMPAAPRVRKKPARTPEAGTSGLYYRGRLPNRQLLIGQFLYFSGAVSWMALIDAIVWQRRQRPRIGQLAVEWGLLNQQDIIRIIAEKALREKFGECARRLGYFTGFEHTTLVGRQRRMQRRLGQYFVARDMLSQREVIRMLLKQKVHNKNVVQWK